MTEQELREKLTNLSLINETPVGIKMYPDDLVITLAALLSEKDMDNLLALIAQYGDTREQEGRAKEIKYLDYVGTGIKLMPTEIERRLAELKE